MTSKQTTKPVRLTPENHAWIKSRGESEGRKVGQELNYMLNKLRAGKF